MKKSLLLLGLIVMPMFAGAMEFTLDVSNDSSGGMVIYPLAKPRGGGGAYYPYGWSTYEVYDGDGNATYHTTYYFGVPDAAFQDGYKASFAVSGAGFTGWRDVAEGAYYSLSISEFSNTSLPPVPNLEIVDGDMSVTGVLDIRGAELTLGTISTENSPGVLWSYFGDTLVNFGNTNNFSWKWAHPHPEVPQNWVYPMSLGAFGELELRDHEGAFMTFTPSSGQIVVHSFNQNGAAIFLDGAQVATQAYVASAMPSFSYLTSNYMPKAPQTLTVGVNSSTLNASGASALGGGAIAHGEAAFAAGKGASALGESTVAMGGGARATQSGNIAIGQGSVSTGQPAMWQGAATGSVAVGTKAEATREVSSAFGPLARAYALESTAVGPLTRAAGPYSLAAGSNTYTETTSVGGLAIGYIAGSTNQYAVAVGPRALGSGERANAMGYWASSQGNDSIAIGSNAVASSSDATALGSNATASKIESTALGHSSTASGPTSLALGAYSTATQQNAVALGVGAQATGPLSFASGSGSTAQGYGQTVLGTFNETKGNPNLADDPQSEILIVGSGFQKVDGQGVLQTTRQNALTVKRNGDTEITGSLKVNGVIRVEEAGDISMGMFTAVPTPPQP